MDNSKVFDEKSFFHQLRPAWTPVNMAIMILFFITGLWILGLAMIAYMIYGKDMGVDLSKCGKAKNKAKRAFRDATGGGFSASGNAAFDDWREAELKRLDEERRKLDDARREFEEYVQELRRARDEEEFKSFRNKRESRQGSADFGDDAQPA